MRMMDRGNALSRPEYPAEPEALSLSDNCLHINEAPVSRPFVVFQIDESVLIDGCTALRVGVRDDGVRRSPPRKRDGRPKYNVDGGLCQAVFGSVGAA